MTFSPGFLEAVKQAAEDNGLGLEIEEERRTCYIGIDGYNPIAVTDIVANLASASVVIEDLGEMMAKRTDAFDLYMIIVKNMGFYSVALTDNRYVVYSVPIHDYGRIVYALREVCTASDYYGTVKDRIIN